MKRLLLTVGTALLITACGTGSDDTGDTGGSPSAAVSGDAVALVVRDMTIDPGDVTAPAGEIALAVTNEGPTPHNVRIRNADGDVLFGTRDLRRDESETATGTLEPGDYTMFCSLPGHESLGVVGTLTVTAP